MSNCHLSCYPRYFMVVVLKAGSKAVPKAMVVSMAIAVPMAVAMAIEQESDF